MNSPSLLVSAKCRAALRAFHRGEADGHHPPAAVDVKLDVISREGVQPDNLAPTTEERPKHSGEPLNVKVVDVIDEGLLHPLILDVRTMD